MSPWRRSASAQKRGELTRLSQTLQAMDNSHVALVAVKLEAGGFKRYRCDRTIPLGVNLNSLTKVLKCAKDDDLCTLKASDDADILTLTYEAKSAYCYLNFASEVNVLRCRGGTTRRWLCPVRWTRLPPTVY